MINPATPLYSPLALSLIPLLPPSSSLPSSLPLTQLTSSDSMAISPNCGLPIFCVCKDILVLIEGKTSDKKPGNWNGPFHSDNATEFTLCSHHFKMGGERQFGKKSRDGEVFKRQGVQNYPPTQDISLQRTFTKRGHKEEPGENPSSLSPNPGLFLQHWPQSIGL